MNLVAFGIASYAQILQARCNLKCCNEQACKDIELKSRCATYTGQDDCEWNTCAVNFNDADNDNHKQGCIIMKCK